MISLGPFLVAGCGGGDLLLSCDILLSVLVLWL